MPAERYFLPQELKLGESYQMTEAEFHHLAHVMRSKEGDEIELINGKGFLASAEVIKIAKHFATLKLIKVEYQPPPPYTLILAQAFPKIHRLEDILEKGTELGATSFRLFPGQYSQKKDFFDNQLKRWHAILIAATKQCGRLYLPELILYPPISQWQKQENETLFFGDTHRDAPLFEQVWKAQPSSAVIFATGPEGGFSPNEITLLKKLGGKGVKLHPNILRTETASLCALSLVSHWFD